MFDITHSYEVVVVLNDREFLASACVKSWRLLCTVSKIHTRW